MTIRTADLVGVGVILEGSLHMGGPVSGAKVGSHSKETPREPKGHSFLVTLAP